MIHTINPLKIAENIYHIYEPGNVLYNIDYRRGEGIADRYGLWIGDLAAFVRTLTDKPLEVVLTHGHTDHCGGNYEFPTVYMNLMDVPTYLWYEATQKTLIVEKFKRDRSCGRSPSCVAG